MQLTPKEKAKELVDKFKAYAHGYNAEGFNKQLIQNAKQCALVSVNEILNLEVWNWPHNTPEGFYYWLQVKEEINNL